MSAAALLLQCWMVYVLVIGNVMHVAAQPATLTRLLQEQLMSYYGTIDFTNFALRGISYYTYGQYGASGAAFAYNSDGSYSYTPSSEPCTDFYYYTFQAEDQIGPFNQEALATQMRALAPAAANLVGNLCAANTTCVSQLAPLLPAGQSLQQAANSWATAQATAWNDNFIASFNYDPAATYCPSALSSGIFEILTRAPQSTAQFFGVEQWPLRVATAAANVGATSCSATKSAAPAYDRLLSLRNYALPSWLALAERLVRDLAMHNAPAELQDANGYNIVLSPELATAAYGGGSGKRRLLGSDASASPSVTTARGPHLTGRQQLAATSDCSDTLTAQATELQAYVTSCNAAAAVVRKAVAAQEGAASGAACGAARMGMGLLSDALAVCPAGMCAARNTTLAAAALAKTCASMAPGSTKASDLSWTEILSSTCGVAQTAAQALADAATCCGANCAATRGCQSAVGGTIRFGFPDALYGGAAGSGIC